MNNGEKLTDDESYLKKHSVFVNRTMKLQFLKMRILQGAAEKLYRMLINFDYVNFYGIHPKRLRELNACRL